MSHHSLTIRAPAKINLFLHILNQKPNGYHTLQTLFQFISLYDSLHLRAHPDKEIHFSCDSADIPLENQLIVKAARLLQATTHCHLGATIHLTKNIPMEAGLGGGSSDAASTLLALNHLWACGLSNAALQQLGLQLGADVPFFIHGYSAFASGIGATFQAAAPPESWYVIAKPNCGSSTSAIFNHPDLTRNSSAIDIDHYDYAQTRNDCEPLVRQLYPEVDTVCQWLSAYGSPRLTGTGACVFLALSEPHLWPHIQASKPLGCELWLCTGLNQSPVWLDLQKYDHELAQDE